MAGFALDDTAIVLLLALLAVLLYLRVFNSVTPLVHPLLLGKQSEVGLTRDRGESAIYRSWATGLGTPLTVRPLNSLKTVSDIVSAPAKARCVLDHNLSNESLETLAKTLSYALPQLFPTLTNNKTPVLSTLSAEHSLPILLLALSRRSAANPVILLNSQEHFTKALSPSSNALHQAPGLVVVSLEQLEDVVEQVIDDDGASKVGVLVIGAATDALPSGAIASGVVKLAEKEGVAVKFWEDVWEYEDKATEQENESTAQPNDTHSFIYNESGSALPVTHENITAGIAGIFSMFPADKRPTAQDVVASSVPLTEAFGLSLALGSIWAGAGFRIINSSSLSTFVSDDPEDNRPAPSLVFLSKTLLLDLTSALDIAYRRSALFSIAARHKALGLSQGVISRNGLFESLVWRRPRNSTLNGFAGSKLRACVLVHGSLSQNQLARAHLALSLPLTRIFKSSISAGPVTASHFYDLQCDELAVDRPLSVEQKGEFEVAHVGPPASNVELRLRFPNGAEPEEDEPIGGAVEVRGPAILAKPGEWVDTGRNAVVRTNGTFVLA